MYNSKQSPNKGIKNFFPKKFTEDLFDRQKNVSLNAMNFFNGKRKIIREFEKGDIKPSNFPHNALNLEPEPEPEPEPPKESIREK